MKTSIITGAYGKIGFTMAEKIALQGYQIHIIGKDFEKIQNAKNKLIQNTRNQNIFSHSLDLSDWLTIYRFAESFPSPVNLLINNAGTTPRKRTENSQGKEMQWSVNVMGYFAMIYYFQNKMAKNESSIINIASYWAGGLDLSDVEFKNRPYNNDTAYRASKQADRMLSCTFSKILKKSGIHVHSAHPGDVRSKLSSDLGFGGHETPEEAARTPLFAALEKPGTQTTGKYFEHLQMMDDPFCQNKNNLQKLYDICLSYL